MSYRIGLSAICAVTLFLLPTTASAATVTWIGAAGGAYSDGANWDLGTPPDVGDTALFDRPGEAFTVTFDAESGADTIVINAGDVTFDLNGNTFHAVDTGTSGRVGDADGDYAAWRVTDGYLEAFGSVDVATAPGSVADLEVADGGTLEIRIASGGTLDLSSGGTATLIASSGGEAIAQTINIADDGVLDGDGGTVQGWLNTSGFSSPAGAGVGNLTIDGNYVQTIDGTLSIDIAGTGEGEYDTLTVSNVLRLEGTLQLNLIDGFVPEVGDTLTFTTFASRSSGFSFLEAPIPDGSEGHQWQFDYGDTYTSITWVETLKLEPPSPGISGEVNTFSISSGATPGELIIFLFGNPGASLALPDCPALYSPLGSISQLGGTAADATGAVAYDTFIPSGASGRTMNLMAIEKSTCRLSEVVVWTFL